MGFALLFVTFCKKDSYFLIIFEKNFNKALFFSFFLLYNRLWITVRRHLIKLPRIGFRHAIGEGKEGLTIMKQKYTITVADMELSIISDASPDEVENIVGMLDRRMRDINLKSPRCTKNEAAILCALTYCSERLAMQEAFKKVEKDAFRFAGENEKLKKTIESMQDELDTLRKDASVMRSILDRATIAAIPQPEAEAKTAPVPQPTLKKAEKAEEIDSAEQLSAFDAPEAIPASAPVASVAPEATDAEAPAQESKKSQKNAPKSRVGTMFDLLTFSDI